MLHLRPFCWLMSFPGQTTSFQPRIKTSVWFDFQILLRFSKKARRRNVPPEGFRCFYLRCGRHRPAKWVTRPSYRSRLLCEGLFIHVDVHDAKQWSIQYQSAAVIGSFSLFLFCGIIDVQAGSIFRSCFWDHRWDRSGAPLAAFHGPDGEPVLWGDTDPPIMGPHCSPLQKVRTHLWFLTDEIMLLFTWTYDSLSLNRKQTNIYNVRIYSPKNIQFSLIFSVLHTDIYTWMYLYLEDQRVSKYVFRWKNI